MRLWLLADRQSRPFYLQAMLWAGVLWATVIVAVEVPIWILERLF